MYNLYQKLSFILVFLMLNDVTFAYIGPGMSGGVIATILGIIGSIFLAIFSIVYYPIKRYLKKKKILIDPIFFCFFCSYNCGYRISF